MTPSALIAEDFDGDKRMDLAVLNKGTSTLLVLLGDGTGALIARGRSTAPGAPIAALSGYVDADSSLDILVAGTNESFVLLGDGTGGFTAGPPIDVGASILGVGLGDLNGDRFADLVVTTFAADSAVRILLGMGGGRFAPPRRHTTLNTTNKLLLTDFNRDGLLDVLVNSNGVAGITVLDNRSL